MDRLEIVRECLDAYVRHDKATVARHHAPGFTFSAPPDVGLDSEQFFARCWPDDMRIEEQRIVRLFAHGDDVVVTYESKRTGRPWGRNTEVLVFEGDRIVAQEVYFGWELRDR